MFFVIFTEQGTHSVQVDVISSSGSNGNNDDDDGDDDDDDDDDGDDDGRSGTYRHKPKVYLSFIIEKVMVCVCARVCV